MLFFVKNKKIVIDAFTANPGAYKFFPVSTANNYVPDWWKNLPKNYIKEIEGKIPTEVSTARRCTGVIEYYAKNNIVIPLWTDIKVEHSPNGFQYVAADGETNVTTHEQGQRGFEYLNNYDHLKIVSAWKFQEKTGVKFHFSQPFYNFKDPRNILIPPAIVNYKYQNSTEINFFVRRMADKNLLELKAGQPMVHLTPMSDKDVEIKHHLISSEEYHQKFHWVFSFSHAYFNAKKIMEKKEKKSKCPFHFG